MADKKDREYAVGQIVFIACFQALGWYVLQHAGEYGLPFKIGVPTPRGERTICFTPQGRQSNTDEFSVFHRTDFHGNGAPERKVNWSKVPVGTKVLAKHRNEDHLKIHEAHFAGVIAGRTCCYYGEDSELVVDWYHEVRLLAGMDYPEDWYVDFRNGAIEP